MTGDAVTGSTAVGEALPVVVEVHLGPDEMAGALRADAQRGLTATPKVLSPLWFYDEVGCRLFDEITRLDEYYPTRREREILEAHAGDIAAATQAATLVELGSGTSEKTRLLLDALAGAECLRSFVPFDCAETTLRAAAEAVAEEYPGTMVHAVVGDFGRHIPVLAQVRSGSGRRMVAFLGSTIGNLDPAGRAALLAEIAGGLRPGDSLLLGCDLVKDVARLEAAYNDSRGVTAAFNLNVLSVLNRELAADFDPDRFEHVAVFDRTHERIEMRLRSREHQEVRVRELGLALVFEHGEELRTEISTKFRPSTVRGELAAAGLDLRHVWTDTASDFGLFLAFK